MIDAMPATSTLPSEITARHASTVNATSMSMLETALPDVSAYEDSFGDGGFDAIRGDLVGLLDVLEDESRGMEARRQQAPGNGNVAAEEQNGTTKIDTSKTLQLRLTVEERDAEVHIFGENHWEYSKVCTARLIYICTYVCIDASMYLFLCICLQMMDFLAECYYKDFTANK